MQLLPRIALRILLPLAVAACTGAPPRPAPPSRVLVVGSDLDNKPFAWIDEGGTPRGRDVEMMEQLARALDRDLEWRRMPFAELLPAVLKGELDLACATIGITPERALCVLFTEPYFVTEIAVVARSGKGEPRWLEDLPGRRVLASPGTTSERALRIFAPRAVFVAGDDAERTTKDRLLARDVDAAVLDGPAANALVQASDGAFVRLPGRLCEERYALALPKDRKQLGLALDAELARMRLSGGLERLDVKYGLRAPEHALR